MRFYWVSALIVLFIFQIRLKWPEPFPVTPVVIHQVRWVFISFPNDAEQAAAGFKSSALMTKHLLNGIQHSESLVQPF